MQVHLVIPDPDDSTAMPIFDRFASTATELSRMAGEELEPGTYKAVITDFIPLPDGSTEERSQEISFEVRRWW